MKHKRSRRLSLITKVRIRICVQWRKVEDLCVVSSSIVRCPKFDVSCSCSQLESRQLCPSSAIRDNGSRLCKTSASYILSISASNLCIHVMANKWDKLQRNSHIAEGVVRHKRRTKGTTYVMAEPIPPGATEHSHFRHSVNVTISGERLAFRAIWNFRDIFGSILGSFIKPATSGSRSIISAATQTKAGEIELALVTSDINGIISTRDNSAVWWSQLVLHLTTCIWKRPLLSVFLIHRLHFMQIQILSLVWCFSSPGKQFQISFCQQITSSVEAGCQQFFCSQNSSLLICGVATIYCQQKHTKLHLF